jgi:hypothetical protein
MVERCAQLVGLRGREISLRLQHEEVGGQPRGTTRLLRRQPPLRQLARRGGSLDLLLRGANLLGDSCDLRGDGDLERLQLHVDLTLLHLRSRQRGLRRGVAQRQGDVETDAPAGAVWRRSRPQRARRRVLGNEIDARLRLLVQQPHDRRRRHALLPGNLHVRPVRHGTGDCRRDVDCPIPNFGPIRRHDRRAPDWVARLGNHQLLEGNLRRPPRAVGLHDCLVTGGNFRFRLDDVDGGDGAKVDAAAVFVELPLRQRLRLPGRRKRIGREDQLPIGAPHVRKRRRAFLTQADIGNLALDPRLDDCGARRVEAQPAQQRLPHCQRHARCRRGAVASEQVEGSPAGAAHIQRNAAAAPGQRLRDGGADGTCLRLLGETRGEQRAVGRAGHRHAVGRRLSVEPRRGDDWVLVERTLLGLGQRQRHRLLLRHRRRRPQREQEKRQPLIHSEVPRWDRAPQPCVPGRSRRTRRLR